MDKALRFKWFRFLWLAVVIGLAAVFLLLELLGVTSAVLAHEQARTESIYLDPLYQPPPPADDDWAIIVVFTEPVPIQITDLSGNVIGEGVHAGEAKCKRDNCGKKTDLTFGIPVTEPVIYEYKFAARQALDPVDEIVIVSGTGSISSRGGKERFSFTATIQNNRDGTVWVRYEASRPDASFIIPRAPGTFEIRSRLQP